MEGTFPRASLPQFQSQGSHQLSALGRSFHSPCLNILLYNMGTTIVPMPRDCLNRSKVTKTVPGISQSAQSLLFSFNPLKIWALKGIMFPLFPLWLSWERIRVPCGKPGFDPWVGKIPWRRKWHTTPVVLPGEFHGQWSLASYSPWDHKELDMTEQLSLTQSGSLLFHS